MQNTTSTKKSADVADNTSSVSGSVSTIQMSTEVETSPNQSNMDKTDISRSPSLQQGRKSNTEVLSVSLSLVLGVLAAVGVVIAVLFVRWKR